MRQVLVMGWVLGLALGCQGGGGGTTPDGGTDVGPCGLGFLGDPTAPPRFTPTALGPEFTAEPLAEGSSVSLLFAPQGGFVAFIGVRGATNLDPCGVHLLAAVRDASSRKLQLDARTLNLSPGPDGLGTSTDLDISTFANVALCPNQWSDEAVFDHDYELTLVLTDRRERSVTQTLTIRPACDGPDDATLCRCLCKKDYTLGEVCEALAPPGGGT